MPIPKTLSTGVLPPFLKSPARRDGISPYHATSLELIERYATSTQRIRILDGLLAYRAELRRAGLASGFQWIAGSFVEVLNREPNDADVVTFAPEPASHDVSAVDLLDPEKAKARFLCDAWFVDLSCAVPAGLVSDVTYWFGLFSHQKQSQRWKGMVQLDLITPDADASARERLATLKKEPCEPRG